MKQLRQELGQRLIEKVYDQNTNKPSKVSVIFIMYTFKDFLRIALLYFSKVLKTGKIELPWRIF